MFDRIPHSRDSSALLGAAAVIRIDARLRTSACRRCSRLDRARCARALAPSGRVARPRVQPQCGTHQCPVRSKRGPHPPRSSRSHSFRPLFAAVLFGPLAAAVVGAHRCSVIRSLRRAAIRSRAQPEVGDLHLHPFHRRRSDGLRAQATLAVVPSEFGGLVAASLVGSGRRRAARRRVLGLTLQFADGSDARRIHDRRLAIGAALGTGLCTDRRSPRVRICRGLTVDARTLPRASDGRPTPLRPLPGAAPAG